MVIPTIRRIFKIITGTNTNTSYDLLMAEYFAKSVTLEQFTKQKYTNEQVENWRKATKDKELFYYDGKITHFLTLMFLQVKKDWDNATDKTHFVDPSLINKDILTIITPVQTRDNYQKLIITLDNLDFGSKHKVIIFHNMIEVFIKYDTNVDSENYRTESYLYNYLFKALEDDTCDEPFYRLDSKAEDILKEMPTVIKHWDAGTKTNTYWREFLLRACEVKRPFRFSDLFHNPVLMPSKELFLIMADKAICDEYFYKKCSKVVCDVASFVDNNYSSWADTPDMKHSIEYLSILPTHHLKMVWDKDSNKILRESIRTNNYEILKLVTKIYTSDETKPILIGKYYDPLHYADYHALKTKKNAVEFRQLIMKFSDSEYYARTKILSKLIPIDSYFIMIKKLNFNADHIEIKGSMGSHNVTLKQYYDKDTKTLHLEKIHILDPPSDFHHDVAEYTWMRILIPLDAENISFKSYNKDYFKHDVVDISEVGDDGQIISKTKKFYNSLVDTSNDLTKGWETIPIDKADNRNFNDYC